MTKRKRLPAHIVIKSEMLSIEIKTLTNGNIMLRLPYWAGRNRKASVTLYYPPACLSFMLIDPIAKLLKQRLNDAQDDADRMKKGLE